MRVSFYLRITSLCIVLHLILTTSIGQNASVEKYGIEEGLSQGFISSILQDREGFIWVGTKNGLSRFDGKQFITFSSSSEIPFPLKSEYITSIVEYGDFLILGTYGDGITFYHKLTRKFIPLPLETLEISAQRSPAIRRIAVDKKGNLWYLDWKQFLSGHLFQIKLPSGFWQNLTGKDPDFNQIEIIRMYDNLINDFYMSHSGENIFFGEKKNIGIIQTDVAKLQLYVLPERVHFSGFAEDLDGNIWVSSDDGLSYFTKNGWTKIKSDQRFRNLITIDNNRTFYFENEKRELVSAIVNEFEGQLIAKENYGELEFYNVGIFDNSGNLWIGTGGKGLHKYNISSHYFKTLFKNASISAPPIHLEYSNEIICFSEQNLLLSSKPERKTSDILSKMKIKDGRSYFTRHIYLAGYGDCFLYFEATKEQYELQCFDFKNQKSQTFPLDLKEEYLGNICQDKNGLLYIAINGKLTIFNPKNSEQQILSYDSLLPYGHDVRVIEFINGQDLLLGTSAGLIRAQLKHKQPTFERIGHREYPQFTFKNQDISSLAKDPLKENLWWVGTKGAGIYRYNISNESVSHISTKSGLANNVIYGMLFDSNHNLWVSSNQGLTQYKPHTPSQSKSYTTKDGLQGLEFNTWAFSKSKDGLFMFGGVNGLNIFRPEDILENQFKPSAFVSSLKINKKLITPGDHSGLLERAIEFTSQLKLKHYQNNINLELSATEYTRPAKNKFKFFLEGAEEPWSHEQFNSEVQYLNLAPGKYTFFVKASNNDGLYSEKATSLKIIITPPFYQSNMAYFFYIIVICLLIYGFVQFRLRQIKLQNQLIWEQQEIDRIKGLNDFKNNLYTNITHEFRTPISIIQGASSQLLDELEHSDNAKRKELTGNRTKRNLQLIFKNGKQLLELVNQILDLSKLTENKVEVHLTFGDIVNYTRELVNSFNNLAFNKDIDLVFSTNIEELHIYFDKDKIKLIINNLLNNSIKFGQKGGKIQIDLMVLQLMEAHSFLQISVADNGPGIKQEEIPYIFDRFYQGSHESNKASGTGIGLALSYEMAKIMKGNLSVLSEPYIETKFTLQLPIHKADDLPTDSISKSSYIEAKQNEHIEEKIKSRKNQPKPQLLIVEDNEDIRTFLIHCLTDFYQIKIAGNGTDGLELAFATTPDIILSDIMMPGIDGMKLVEFLKKDIRTSHIPIIMLTAKVDMDTKLSSLENGVDGFITKPFQPKELLLTLQKVLDNRYKLQQYYRNQLNFNKDNGPLPPDSKLVPVEDKFINLLNKALEENYKNAEFSVEQLCRLLNISRTNLHRKLKALTDLSTTAYVNTFKLKKAEELFHKSHLNIGEIAFESGFNDPKYFSRVFTQYFKCSPTEYRKRL